MKVVINNREYETTAVYDEYWWFACRRQDIFWRKQDNDPLCIISGVPRWTDDPILRQYKFTNCYRATDRVSQYLIKNVISLSNKDSYSREDMLFRTLLFKVFNKIETWKTLTTVHDDIRYSSFDVVEWSTHLGVYRYASKHPLYSAAYIMPSYKGNRVKHKGHLQMIKDIVDSGLAGKLVSGEIGSLKGLYEYLLSFDSIGSFLAYQWVIDINYSELCDFDEMEFVVPGPGAKRGIERCFVAVDGGKCDYQAIIRYMQRVQEDELFRVHAEGIPGSSSAIPEFVRIGNRPLQLIDCQNLFCEIDKYARVKFDKDGGKPKQNYKASSLGAIEYSYPSKWGV